MDLPLKITYLLATAFLSLVFDDPDNKTKLLLRVSEWLKDGALDFILDDEPEQPFGSLSYILSQLKIFKT